MSEVPLYVVWGVEDAEHWTDGFHPGVELRANLKSISHGCYFFEVASAWELNEYTIHLPLGCLQGGVLMRVGDAESSVCLQGYLAHKKRPPPPRSP